jgi:hypothetical protein
MKNYRSSSAAYRAIRQYEAKHGKTELTVEKIATNDFVVRKNNLIPFSEFNDTLPQIRNVENNINYRYFPDGVNGVGYYELKTGNRRRPNSIYLSVRNAYDNIVSNSFDLV